VSKHSTQSDLVLRDSGSGGLEIYNVANNAITGAAFLGAVGLDWQPSGFGDFSSRNEGDMLLRNVNTGGLLLYDIANNQITGAFFLGNVGLDWQYAGVAPIQGPGTSDLVLRNVNTGAFQVYNIAGNTLVGSASLGAAGLDWQLGGFAASTPTGSMGSLDGSTSQLVQAMAGFDGGAADSSSAAPLAADVSQQPFLTGPPAGRWVGRVEDPTHARPPRLHDQKATTDKKSTLIRTNCATSRPPSQGCAVSWGAEIPARGSGDAFVSVGDAGSRSL